MMNERILKLATIVIDSMNDDEDLDIFAEKFAELIVKKCATIADFAHLGGVIDPSVMIKEYFGVE